MEPSPALPVPGARRPRSALAAALVVAIAIVAAVAVTATASGATTVSVPVVRCPTLFGIQGQHRHVPATITVSAAGPTHGLDAYTNTEIYLLAPRGFHCSGTVAADGGTEVIAWAPHSPKPVAQHSRGAALTLNIDPACAGCRAADACPFFTAFARQLGFPCTSGVPAGEKVSHPSRTLALFEDPPGVAGSGWPSGGPDPASGVVGLNGSPAAHASVYRSTCTLPQADHAICTDSLIATVGPACHGRHGWVAHLHQQRPPLEAWSS